jgi:hypothetical protein
MGLKPDRRAREAGVKHCPEVAREHHDVLAIPTEPWIERLDVLSTRRTIEPFFFEEPPLRSNHRCNHDDARHNNSHRFANIQ